MDVVQRSKGALVLRVDQVVPGFDSQALRSDIELYNRGTKTAAIVDLAVAFEDQPTDRIDSSSLQFTKQHKESSGSGGAAAAEAAATSAALNGAGAGGKKKFLGLGSYLPKVPSYLLQKNGGAATTTQAAEDPADELKELPDFPDRRSNDADPSHQQQQSQSAAAVAAAALRRRGMSTEQNVSTLYRRMTVRQSSSSTASTDGSPSSRGSLT
ncbi:hypothetical protein Gpo141_00014302, partial [Globisporangium polare]